MTTPDLDRLAALTVDYDGSRMDDREQPRDGLTCGDLRAVVERASELEIAVAQASEFAEYVEGAAA